MHLRREESDCFCIELRVCDVKREDDDDGREVRLEVEEVGVLVEDFNFATRCAVTGSKADTCIGGNEIGDLGFLGSVDDKVCSKN